jgi:hypothetical protein
VTTQIETDTDTLDVALVAAFIGAGAITLEHVAATQISEALRIPREWDIRFGQALGTSTILACYAAAARSGASRGQQIAALLIVMTGCGAAAIGCSAVRWAIESWGRGQRANGRLAQAARHGREDDGLEPWRTGLRAD